MRRIQEHTTTLVRELVSAMNALHHLSTPSKKQAPENKGGVNKDKDKDSDGADQDEVTVTRGQQHELESGRTRVRPRPQPQPQPQPLCEIYGRHAAAALTTSLESYAAIQGETVGGSLSPSWACFVPAFELCCVFPSGHL